MREPSLTHPYAAIFLGDCLDVLAEIPDNSIDAIVTDPPYGLGFMGKAWDDLPPGLPWAQECLRVLKPGGHLLAFGGTRTWHRLAVAVEDAGFEVRDSIAWLYGSGFPKSLDVSKAIDKAAGAERETKPWIARQRQMSGGAFEDRAESATHGNLQCPVCLKWKFAPDHCVCPRDNGAQTPAAQQWQGWGTALKPAFEPIVVARKPLIGTGALNVDGCRVGDGSDRTSGGVSQGPMPQPMSWGQEGRERTERASGGRWPTNVVLDGDAAAELNASTDNAARYFPTFKYTAKAPTRERPTVVAEDGTKTAHPTVKPLALMRWLVRLVTPPGGTVLDTFAGSGATIEAAIEEGFFAFGIEREESYLPLIQVRLDRVTAPVSGDDAEATA